VVKLVTALIAVIYHQSSIAAELKLEHVANAGVKISSGESVILVDALFGKHDFYNYVSKKDFPLLLKSNADIALATHKHSDHFGVERVKEFLNYLPNALFFSTTQVVGILNGKVNDKQIKTAALTGFESVSFNHNNIAITALNLPHVGSKQRPDIIMPNYGYLIEVNGWKILHVGDAIIDESVIAGLKLDEMNIDVALLPSWIPEEKGGLKLIESMKVGKVVFMHLVDSEMDTYLPFINKSLPKASVLITSHPMVALSK